jgi:hypothetical protein
MLNILPKPKNDGPFLQKPIPILNMNELTKLNSVVTFLWSIAELRRDAWELQGGEIE